MSPMNIINIFIIDQGGVQSCSYRATVDFSSNPSKTHLSKRIKVLLQTSCQVFWGKLELNSAGQWHFRTEFTPVTDPLNIIDIFQL